jgi:hypothetical protein
MNSWEITVTPNLYFWIAILYFGAMTAIALLIIYAVLKTDTEWDDASVRLICIVLVLMTTGFLVTGAAGFASEKYITPAVGLLGTIVGYLLRGER